MTSTEFAHPSAPREELLQSARLDAGFSNFINGQAVSPGGRLHVVNPATGEIIASVPDAGQEALDQAVQAARDAFPAWAATPWAERRKVLELFLKRMEEHQQELVALLTAETGRPLATSAWELGGAIHAFGPTLLGLELPQEHVDSPSRGKVIKRHVPLGVVCAISPWNVPVLLSCVKVLSALLTGNTIVLKPSPFAPLTVLRVMALANDLLPPGVLNVITGGDDLGPLMTAHPGFDKVTFTGSTQTGKRVLSSAAPTLKRVTLELGGNDPAIVLPDADPQAIAEPLFWSMFMLNGHACISLKRLYVHESIYPAVTQALQAYAAQIKTGDGFDPHSALGPVQNRMQFERILETWSAIQASRTPVLYQGQAPEQGYFFPVTLLDNPQEDAAFVSKEVFGPIRAIMKYTDLDDAIRRANDTPYGLGASVWGQDAEQLRAVADRLNAGTVWINQHANLSIDLPFGGHKESGVGVEFGVEGLKSYCNVRVITAI
ncbi:aldehyde dehydrogenase family protein [Pseudomonas sp. NPDC089554]|uniref:aldehyde dehydrogenase family protein n=1 Tax=Pseudomonas sp. NPDC089554 TaxID=3390653 RepID=UPI003D07B1D5